MKKKSVKKVVEEENIRKKFWLSTKLTTQKINAYCTFWYLWNTVFQIYLLNILNDLVKICWKNNLSSHTTL
jgi:hypothetical protein